MVRNMIVFSCAALFTIQVGALEHLINLSRHIVVKELNVIDPLASRTQGLPFTSIVKQYARPSAKLPSLVLTLPESSSLQLERIQNLVNLQYTGELYLGSPGQKMRLIFDTGSSDLWATDQAFIEQLSRTWKSYGPKETLLQYGKGSARGEFGQDTVCLATSPDPLCVTDQPLIVAKHVEKIPLGTMDGILGLGFHGISHHNGTFLTDINTTFAELCFAFALKDVAKGQSSYVAIGEYEEVMQRGYRETGLSKDAVAFAEVQNVIKIDGVQGLQPGWWLVTATISIGDIGAARWELLVANAGLWLQLLSWLWVCYYCMRRGCEDKTAARGIVSKWFSYVKICTCCGTGTYLLVRLALSIIAVWSGGERFVYAALDTGTSLMAIPETQSDRSFSHVTSAMFGKEGSKNCFLTGDGLVCDCSIAESANPLIVEIGGIPIILNAKDMFLEVGKGLCLTGISPSPMPFWILGDVFLRRVYAVHNFNRQTVALFPYESTPIGVDMAASAFNKSNRIAKLAVLAIGTSAAALVVALVARTRHRMQIGVVMEAVDYVVLPDVPNMRQV